MSQSMSLAAPPPPPFAYVRLHDDAPHPRRAYDRPAGTDIAAFNLSDTGNLLQVLIPPNCTRAVGTGLRLIAPLGFFYAVCSRSGLASGNNPLFVANAPGIIDPDYQGELRVLLYNGGSQSAYIKTGDFIAQVILLPHLAFSLREIPRSELTNEATTRAARGFGSTGLT